MVTVYFKPHPALLDYVEVICIMQDAFETDDLLSPIYTYMPTHTRFLCFYLEDPVKVKKEDGEFEERARAIIIGTQLLPVTLDLGKKHTAVIVILKPCGLYRLLGIPQHEIVDCDFEASLLLGNDINELTERLWSKHEEKNTTIQNYLLSRLTKLKAALPIDKAILPLVRAQGNLSMDFLASQSCLSLRQMERLSLPRIGLSPKFYARIVRFSEAYKYKERYPHSSWTEIAHGFGYYDQMHFIREFKCFTGFNPGILKEGDILKSVGFNSLDP
jgi:AraC-like DNA-binding protein